MLLNLIMPDMSQKLQKLASIPLKNYKITRSALGYLEAVIKSGIAAEADSGVVYVMGNTNVGKSSLVNTLVRFMENPSDDPVPFLTQNGRSLRVPLPGSIQLPVLAQLSVLTQLPVKSQHPV